MSSSTNIDKSLDEIIGSEKKNQRKTVKPRAGVAKKRINRPGVKKDVSKIKDVAKKQIQKQTQKKQDDPFFQATKVNISNFPADITEGKLKQYLNTDFGSVGKVEGVYNKNGQPTGKFTVIFKNEGVAIKVFEKLNGTPMDNGKRVLTVEIVTDPTKKSLASRLGVAPKAAPAGATAKPKTKAKPKPKPKKKFTRAKTADELDAEMVDYFKDSKKDEISI